MVAERTDEEESNGKRFAAQLQQIMNERGWNQADLSRHIGVTQQTVSDWVAGRLPRDPARVFWLEDKLNVPGGFISHVLGYTPVGVSHVPSAIDADPHLPDEWKWALKNLYRQARELSERVEAAEAAAAANGKGKR
jgi:transcriptional regulator with XRE-family HTH domain